MDHDRLFKDLLTNFFVEFIELFFPEIAAELDHNSIEFLDKEIFHDLNSGDRHEVDLLAKARLAQQETFILIHVENQASYQADFPRRMFRYFSLLHGKFDMPIYPIAVLSFDHPLKPAVDLYEINLFDFPVLKFRFRPIQINQLNWREFVNKPNPVATALMAKMNIAPQDRVRVKLECLRMLVTLKLDPARTELIGGFMNSYLRLTASETVVYNQGVQTIEPEQRKIVMAVINEWKEMAKVELVTFQLSRRFGELPIEFTEAVAQLSTDQITELAGALLDFKTLIEAREWVAQALIA